MTTSETPSMKNPAKESLLPGILAAVVMLAIAAARVFSMLAYNKDLGGTLLMLTAGAFVYFATMGYQKWRAECPAARWD